MVKCRWKKDEMNVGLLTADQQIWISKTSEDYVQKKSGYQGRYRLEAEEMHLEDITMEEAVGKDQSEI